SSQYLDPSLRFCIYFKVTSFFSAGLSASMASYNVSSHSQASIDFKAYCSVLLCLEFVPPGVSVLTEVMLGTCVFWDIAFILKNRFSQFSSAYSIYYCCSSFKISFNSSLVYFPSI